MGPYLSHCAFRISPTSQACLPSIAAPELALKAIDLESPLGSCQSTGCCCSSHWWVFSLVVTKLRWTQRIMVKSVLNFEFQVQSVSKCLLWEAFSVFWKGHPSYTHRVIWNRVHLKKPTSGSALNLNKCQPRRSTLVMKLLSVYMVTALLAQETSSRQRGPVNCHLQGATWLTASASSSPSCRRPCRPWPCVCQSLCLQSPGCLLTWPFCWSLLVLVKGI